MARLWDRAPAMLSHLPVVPVVMASAAAITLPGIGAAPLSWDEAVSVAAARRSLPQLAHLLRHTDAPLGLYYLLLRGWITALRSLGIVPTEAWLRLPSALAGILAVGLTARLAGEIGGRRVAWLAGLLLAVWPLFEFYSQDARPYSAAAAAVVAGTLALLRARVDPRLGRLVLYGGCIGVAVYLQLFAVLALVPHLIVALRSGTSRRRLLLAEAAAVVTTLPLLVIAIPQRGEVGWIPPVTTRRIFGFLVTVSGAAVVAGVLFVLVVVLILRRVAVANSAVFLGQAFLPPVLLVLASVSVFPILVPRYALVAVPAAAVLTAAAVMRLPARMRAAFAVALLTAGLGTVVVQRQVPYKYENFRAITDHIEDCVHSGDSVLFRPTSFRVGFAYYATRDPLTVGPADRTTAGLYRGPTIGGTAESPVPRSSRVWLVTDRGSRALPGGYRMEWSRDFGAVALDLLTQTNVA